MICVDSSVAVKWLFKEEWTDQALSLYFATLRTNEIIVAPPLMPIEVTNALRQRMRSQGGPSLAEATQLLDRFLRFRITILDPPELHRQALAIADAYDLPAAYDAHFLALTEQLGCEFWTDDQRLLNQVRRKLPFVRWIADFREQ